MINATLYNKLSYNFIRDIAPVASVASVPLVMQIHPSVPAKTVPEFIVYAKANPGKISMASAGIGNATHVAGELFNMMTGVNMVHVPYRGAGPALADVLGGQVQVLFATPVGMIDYVKAGKLRALAVTTGMRLEMLPDLPTVGDFVPGYEASAFQGIGAPKNTPIEIIDKLNREINAALTDTRLKARLAELGDTPLIGSPADFGNLIAEETEKWARLSNSRASKQSDSTIPAPRSISSVPRGTAMKIPRRQFLHLAAGAGSLPAVSRFAWAQAYPTRPVTSSSALLPAAGPTSPHA
jgi:tripartite-type tricarboxylate transporter receptor subunit TctC